MAKTTKRKIRKRHPKLEGLAMRLANDVCRKINLEAPQIADKDMPYKTQYVLEHVIELLEARV